MHLHPLRLSKDGLVSDIEGHPKSHRLVHNDMNKQDWAAWYITRLLAKLTSKGVVFSFVF